MHNEKSQTLKHHFFHLIIAEFYDKKNGWLDHLSWQTNEATPRPSWHSTFLFQESVTVPASSSPSAVKLDSSLGAVEETGASGYVCGVTRQHPPPPLLFISTSDDRQGQQRPVGHTTSGVNSYSLTFVFTCTFSRWRRKGNFWGEVAQI